MSDPRVFGPCLEFVGVEATLFSEEGTHPTTSEQWSDLVMEEDSRSIELVLKVVKLI